MIKVGIAGIGFMGWIHWLAYQNTEGIEVAAIATPESERLNGDWTSIKGNFGPPGEKVDLTGVETYESLDSMLDCDHLDLIDICLPPALHATAIQQAAAAGKHVFCEKPLALNLSDCDAAIAACRRHNRLLLVGHVLPYFSEFQYALEVIASQRYGRLLGGNFKRVISDPFWLKKFYDPDVIGGPLFDLHIHDAHFIRLLYGMPISVDCCGRVRGEVMEFWNSIFRFADPSLAVTCTSGVINQQGRPFSHGFEIHLEHATIHFEFASLAEPNPPELAALKVFTHDGQVLVPELGDSDPVHAFAREIAEVTRCVTENKPSEHLSGKLARDAVEMCEMQAAKVVRTTPL
jgi:predicted dehydrogenase